MEIGNLLFGHSRGAYEVPRDVGFEDALRNLLRALSYLGECDGYGQEYVGDVFEMHRYWWGDCDCGFQEKFDRAYQEWHKTNKHYRNCYRSRVYSAVRDYDAQIGYVDEFDSDSATYFDVEPLISAITCEKAQGVTEYQIREMHREFERETQKRFCAEMGLPYPEGSAVHCTCEYESRYAEFYASQGSHNIQCGVERPNFWYKPTGFQLRWYKYPLRDSYTNMSITLDGFRSIINHCIESVANETNT